MTKKSTGREVREAYDGPTVDHDALISNIEARIREEHARQSDGSESAAKTAAFLEETGLNSQAFSWGGVIVRKLAKKDGQMKAMDIIRSLKTIIPMIESHVAGQGSVEMNLGGDKPDQDAGSEPEEEQEDEPASIVTPIDFGGSAK